MLRKLALIALVPLLASVSPALAVTAKEKQETCKIGAQAQNLEGKKATDFVKKCLAKGNYEPAARKAAMKGKKKVKKKVSTKKPAPKPMAAPPPPQEKKDGSKNPRRDSDERDIEESCRKPIMKVTATNPTGRRPRRAFSSKARTSSTGA